MPESIYSELKSLLWLAFPAVVSSCSTTAMTVTDQIMVGHLGRTALAAAAIGNTFYSLMLYFQLGFATALDTKASQAHGRNDRQQLIAWTASSLVLGTLTTAPMVLALLFAGPVAAVAFQQSAPVAASVGAFCARLAPGVLPQILGTLLIKALQAQNLMAAPALLCFAAFLANIGLNFLLIDAYGFLGAPIATSLSRTLFLLLAVALMLHTRAQQRRDAAMSNGLSLQFDASEGAWGGIGERSLQTLRSTAGGAGAAAAGLVLEWPAIGAALRRGLSWHMLEEFGRLGVAGGAMVAFEASSFDLTTAMAAALGVVAADAHVTLLTIISFNFMSLPFGIATAATIRVGNLLGAGRAAAARRASWLAVALGAASMFVCAIAMVVFRTKLAYVFIDDGAVRALAAKIAVVAACSEVADGVMGTSQGALRGAGRQRELMVYNFVGFWCVGLSLGATLTFSLGLGLPGLWLGILLGVNSVAVLNIRALLAVRWDAEAAAAVEASRRAERGTDAAGDGFSEMGSPTLGMLKISSMSLGPHLSSGPADGEEETSELARLYSARSGADGAVGLEEREASEEFRPLPA